MATRYICSNDSSKPRLPCCTLGQKPSSQTRKTRAEGGGNPDLVRSGSSTTPSSCDLFHPRSAFFVFYYHRGVDRPNRYVRGQGLIKPG
ncbi:hypothetical protein JTE90_015672 [Oedothorax gibbosus]|uniref:Uncharacterized protein n=1 Tax=Oedothorax gibbosus TaxID=931172 RepID=A0AAV6TCP8_9ARAC|nr:hypothetical protein JTE90_015672 [Oedothorax gibbosus]